MSVFKNIKSKFDLVDNIKNDVESCIKIIKDENDKLKKLDNKITFNDDNELLQYQSETHQSEQKILNTKDALKSYIPVIMELFEAIPYEIKEFFIYGDQNSGQSIFKQDKKLLLSTKRLIGVESKSEIELLIDLEKIENAISL
jgi:hypothetical protein